MYKYERGVLVLSVFLVMSILVFGVVIAQENGREDAGVVEEEGDVDSNDEFDDEVNRESREDFDLIQEFDDGQDDFG